MHNMETSNETKATCPVMGYQVDKAAAESHGLVREVDGKKYYLCCDHCGPSFDADPEKFIKKLQASEK